MKPKSIDIGRVHGSDAPFLLTPEVRATGLHVMGAPGVGKSKLLELIGMQDVRHGHGLLYLDPHGTSFRELVRFCARHQLRRRIYVLDVSGGQQILGFNPFGRRPGSDTSTRVERGVTAILKAWGVQNPDETPRLLRWLRNTITLAIERDVSVIELALLFDPANDALRAYLASDTSVAPEWQALNQLRTVSQFDEQIQSTKNRLDVLARSRTTRRFFAVTDPQITLDLGRAMDEAAVILVNLQPSENLDPRNARLFGTLLLSELFDAVRQRRPRFNRPIRPFSVIVDEAQNFITADVPELFAQGRKFGLFLTVAHQFADQMRHEDERIWSALNGAARTKILFAVGSDADAKELVHEMYPGQIDYKETKHISWQTKFRPYEARTRTIARTHGGSTGRSRGWQDTESYGSSHGTGRSTSRTAGRSRGHTTTRSTGKTVTQGTNHSISHGKGSTWGTATTRTTGRTTTRTVADGVTESHTASRSRTSGTAQSTGHSHSRGSSGGTTTTRSVTIQRDADGSVISETYAETTSPGWSQAEGFSTSQTRSESTTEGESESFGTSHVESDSEGVSESEAHTHSASESTSESETDGWTRGTADSESLAEGDTETDTESVSDGESWSESESESTSRGRSRSKTDARSWSETESDGPVTRHEEFRESAVEFFGLEEQRQRAADGLRLQAQRVFTIRTPDGRAQQVMAPHVQRIKLSDRVADAYQAAMARRSGALSAAQVDALIDDRVRRVLQEAKTFFDGEETPPVNFIDERNDHVPPIQLKPAARRKKRP